MYTNGIYFDKTVEFNGGLVFDFRLKYQIIYQAIQIWDY